jgi:hypothetical protein
VSVCEREVCEVCVCVCERERERGVCVCVCEGGVCVCVRERERCEFREYQRALAAYKDKLDKVCV